MSAPSWEEMICPLPLNEYPHVLLAHGGGGKLMQQLIEKIFLTAFANPQLQELNDSALLPWNQKNLAFTTDSYVVRPLVFPGGDIGSLAVHGTVNDLAMVGARPLFLSAGFILEEGLPMETLWKVAVSMGAAARHCEVSIVTGDTKVVNKGKGDGIFINSSGVGVLEHPQRIAPKEIRAGDAILLSGDLGRHGVAIMAAREGLEFETSIASDSAPLFPMVQKLLQAGLQIRCMRDLTRGGLASALVELSESSRCNFLIEENTIPVGEAVQGACEILGLDPLYVANEGRFVLFLPQKEVEAALEILKGFPGGEEATAIGKVQEEKNKTVNLRSSIGVLRILDRISGEQLPRIC